MLRTGLGEDRGAQREHHSQSRVGRRRRNTEGAVGSEQGWERIEECRGSTVLRAGLGEDRGEQREHSAQNRVGRGWPGDLY